MMPTDLVLPRSRKTTGSRRRFANPSGVAATCAAWIGAVLVLVFPLSDCEANRAPDGVAPGFTLPIAIACSSDGSRTCASYADPAGAMHEVVMFDGAMSFVQSDMMGAPQVGGGSHRLAYVYGNATRPNRPPAAWISIIDLEAARQVAFVSAPDGYTIANTWFQYITDPLGNKYPFIAPGAHFINVNHENRAKRGAQWNSLCLFDPAFISRPDPACYTGFKHYSLNFTTPDGRPDAAVTNFRHDGGWVEDVDGDGWSDINLPFMQYILTLSGRTGEQIGVAHFDVSAQSEPNSPPDFTGGRFYAGFTAFRDPTSGARDVLFAAANPVGTFLDFNCNVSRYFLVAQWHGVKLEMKWSKYLSFSKTIFSPPYDATNYYMRRGNALDKCAHRFGTSLSYISGHPYIIYDLFSKDDPEPECQEEILAEQRANFTNPTTHASNLCGATKELQVTGKWSVHVRDADNGAEVASYANRYVWGEAPNVLPSGGNALLVQTFSSHGGDVRFDQTGNSLDALAIEAVGNGPSLTELASIAAPPASPKVIQYSDGAYPPGLGSSWRGLTKLVLRDIDGEGLNDIQLRDGRWLGYSRKTHGLVIKTGPESSTPAVPPGPE